MSTGPAIATRPTAPGAVARPRLHALLDAAFSSRLVWLSAMPGAGKTSLASQYVEARGVPHVWCGLAPAGSDLATFFHDLGRGLPHTRRASQRLPVFSADRHFKPKIFVRRYFEALSALLPRESLIVLDDFHEVGDKSPIASVLVSALDFLASTQKVLVLSRTPPPREMARLVATGALHRLDGRELSLTRSETAAIAKRRLRGTRVDDLDIDALHARAGGWVAGLVLLLEREDAHAPTETSTPRSLRDYVVTELWARSPPDVRHALLRLSLPPIIDVRTAEALAGGFGAQLLDQLAERGTFVTRLANGGAASFLIHPLLREALLPLARTELGAERESVLRLAASLCADAGQDDAAVGHLAEIEDWSAVLDLVRARAPALLGQGRHAVLSGWLDRLPASFVAEQPWVEYLRAACADRVPGAGAEGYRRAFERFAASGDRVGQLLAWAGCVSALIVQFDDMARLDPWIAAFEELSPDLDQLPGPVAGAVLAAWISALNYRRIADPRNEAWIDAAIRLLERSDRDPASALFLGYMTESNRWWMGDEAKARVVHDLLGRLLRRHDPPILLTIYGKGVDAWFGLSTADYELCRRSVAEGVALARRHGIVWWDFLLGSLGSYCALYEEDVTAARRFMDEMASGLPVERRRMESAQYGYLMAWAALIERNYSAAVEHGRRGAAACAELGVPFPEALCQMVLAEALVERGDTAAALQVVERAVSITGSSCVMRGHAALVRAQIALRAERSDEAEGHVREAFTTAKEHGLVAVVTFSARSEVIAELCAFALDAEIEPDIARALLVRRPCPSFTPSPTLERWPWHVRIYATGGFEVEIGDAPLRSSAKAQARPLELLQRLAVSGPRGLAETSLHDEMWPDADGDRAERAFTITLHRLRALLGDPTLVRRRGGVVSLDASRVFVDVWAIDRVAARLRERIPDLAERRRLSAALHRLYRGPLLATSREGRDDWAAPARAKLARAVERAKGG
ncbi:MAG: hypothetical protein KF850_27515 [Labilithrix sp.]|nr:hypothetical protein [Labilithrix sp.]MBX3215818.1 hypothetical protein [Labilithrix sp.]